MCAKAKKSDLYPFAIVSYRRQTRFIFFHYSNTPSLSPSSRLYEPETNAPKTINLRLRKKSGKLQFTNSRDLHTPKVLWCRMITIAFKVDSIFTLMDPNWPALYFFSRPTCSRTDSNLIVFALVFR